MLDSPVCVLIVNWNGRRHLEVGLPSLLATRYRHFKIMILDNGSTDGSVDWVQRNFPQIETVSLGANLGFAAANNVGLRQVMNAGNKYAVLLNNDTRVDGDWLEALVEVAEQDPQVALCQARQRTWDGSQEIQFQFVPEWAEAKSIMQPIQPITPPAVTAFAAGCAMLIRVSALEEIGLFDERYFMYVEDLDLSLRSWIAGYKVMDVPSAIVYHRVNGSDSGKKRRTFWGYRNQLTTLLKLYEPGTLQANFGEIGKRWFWTRNRFALHGTIASLSMLPGTLVKRYQIQKRRVCPDTAFLDCSAQ